jgi:hypothetical protein
MEIKLPTFFHPIVSLKKKYPKMIVQNKLNPRLVLSMIATGTN